MYPNQLYHYGVPGMKWGRRKAVQLTSAYAKTGVGKAHMNATKKIVGTTLGAQRKINKAVKNANTPEAQAARKAKMKKAAKIGAAAAGTALAAYGAYKLSQVAKNKNQSRLSSDALKSLGLETVTFDRVYPERVTFDRVRF